MSWPQVYGGTWTTPHLPEAAQPGTSYARDFWSMAAGGLAVQSQPERQSCPGWLTDSHNALNSPTWWAEGQFPQGTSCYYQHGQEKKKKKKHAPFNNSAHYFDSYFLASCGCNTSGLQWRNQQNWWSALKPFRALLSVCFTCSRCAKHRNTD